MSESTSDKSPENTPYYKVFEKCYPLEGTCCHWTLEAQYSKPEMSWGPNIRKCGYKYGPPMDHFKNAEFKSSHTCYNPWNYMNVKNLKVPETEKQPFETNRPIINIKNYNTDLTIKELEGHVCSDCWGLYKHDEYLETTKVYFRSTYDKRDESRISLNESKVISELEPNETLVLIMFGQNSDFVYIRRVGNMFTWVNVIT